MAKKTKKTAFFSALEVANICGVVNQTAINWIKSGYLTGFSTPGGQYRVSAQDLLDFLEKRNMRVPQKVYEVLGRTGSPTFLVIDDDREFNEMVCTYLGKAFPGAKVHQAFDGFEAGTMVGRVKPLVVILDMNLPGINGLTVCRNIKSDPDFGRPLIYAISAMDDVEQRDAVLAEGAQAFFPKPLDMDDFLSVIENGIARR